MGWNPDFSYSKTSCLTKLKKPILPNYLSIAGGRIIGFMAFPRVLVFWEIQTASFRFWKQVTVSIFHDGNRYTTGTNTHTHTHTHIYICIYIYESSSSSYIYTSSFIVMQLPQISLFLPFVPIIHHSQQVI